MSHCCYLASVEGGGTSFRVAISELVRSDSRVSDKDLDGSAGAIAIAVDDDHVIRVVESEQIDSSADPKVCLAQCCEFFTSRRSVYGKFGALGVATFGPVGLNRTASNSSSTTYGCILGGSPKALWRNVNVLLPIQQACALSDNEVWIETDVNAPAFAEYLHHNRSQSSKSNRIRSCAYITIGTGVGVGLIVNDEPVHGMMHPEGGHVCIQPIDTKDNDKDISDDDFQGYSWGIEHSPYKGINTVEGVASSIALAERYFHLQQQRQRRQQQTQDVDSPVSVGELLDRDILKTLDDTDPLWEHYINAVANLCVTLLLILSIEKIVIGGGIISRRHSAFMPQIRSRTIDLLNGYLEFPKNKSEDSTNTVKGNELVSIVTTSLYGENAGLVGAIVLSYRAYLRSNTASVITPPDKSIENVTIDEAVQKSIKQAAFSAGLWHGFIVGVVTTLVILFHSKRHHQK